MTNSPPQLIGLAFDSRHAGSNPNKFSLFSLLPGKCFVIIDHEFLSHPSTLVIYNNTHIRRYVTYELEKIH
jgi:hypothetical protein